MELENLKYNIIGILELIREEYNDFCEEYKESINCEFFRFQLEKIINCRIEIIKKYEKNAEKNNK